jgi:hypothetical protein
VKPVKELDLEASIPRCQTLDSKAALIFGAAYLSPSDEAFGARSAPVEIPEETSIFRQKWDTYFETERVEYKSCFQYFFRTSSSARN